jgi:DNA-binding CsgD family transcriptional regulator
MSEHRETAALATAAGRHTRSSGDQTMLQALYELMALVESEPGVDLTRTADLVASALGADLLDIFLVSSDLQMLIAEGTSTTPMGRRQKELGLDCLPVTNGGRAARVFVSGRALRIDRAERDREELSTVVTQLGVRSTLSAPLAIGPRRGVVQAASLRPQAFTDEHLEFLEAVARYLTLTTAHRDGSAASHNGIQEDVPVLATALTRRQAEVAALIAQGLTNSEIANQLVLEHGTVANHVREILGRLGFRNRTEIAIWTARQGIGKPEQWGHTLQQVHG